MDNKAIVKEFIENLASNREKAYELFDENVKAEWPGSGMGALNGKEQLVKLFEENGHNEIVSQSTENLLAEGDMVCGNGTVTTEKDGKQTVSHFADFYKLNNGKITSLTSYVIMGK